MVKEKVVLQRIGSKGRVIKQDVVRAVTKHYFPKVEKTSKEFTAMYDGCTMGQAQSRVPCPEALIPAVEGRVPSSSPFPSLARTSVRP